MKQSAGGPAFPTKLSVCRDTGDLLPHQFGSSDFCATGMSLRDYFAAKAMPEIYNRAESGGFERVAKLAYELADAMLAAREGK